MARLTSDQGARLEQELVDIFQKNPSERYQNAFNEVLARHPDLDDVLSMNDLNYRIPKLRRAGSIPPSNRVLARRGQSAPSSGQQHPVPRAYQELDAAHKELQKAQQRYEQAEKNLRSVLRESLPSDFLETLANEREGSGRSA